MGIAISVGLHNARARMIVNRWTILQTPFSRAVIGAQSKPDRARPFLPWLDFPRECITILPEGSRAECTGKRCFLWTLLLHYGARCSFERFAIVLLFCYGHPPAALPPEPVESQVDSMMTKNTPSSALVCWSVAQAGCHVN